MIIGQIEGRPEDLLCEFLIADLEREMGKGGGVCRRAVKRYKQVNKSPGQITFYCSGRIY